jgi:hypothetical protein
MIAGQRSLLAEKAVCDKLVCRAHDALIAVGWPHVPPRGRVIMRFAARVRHRPAIRGCDQRFRERRQVAVNRGPDFGNRNPCKASSSGSSAWLNKNGASRGVACDSKWSSSRYSGSIAWLSSMPSRMAMLLRDSSFLSRFLRSSRASQVACPARSTPSRHRRPGCLALA